MRRDVAEVLLSGVSSLVLGEVARFAGRKTNLAKAGLISDAVIPLAGGVAVGGAGLAKGNVETAPWVVGSTLGSALAAVRPNIWSTKEEKKQSLINQATKGLLNPDDTKVDGVFGMSEKEIQQKGLRIENVMDLSQIATVKTDLPFATLGPQLYLDPKYLKLDSGPIVRKSDEWLKIFYKDKNPAALDTNQRIYINSVQDFHKIGDMFAAAVWSMLSGSNDATLQKVINFVKKVDFRTGGALLKFRVEQIMRKLKTSVNPEVIWYPEYALDVRTGNPARTFTGIKSSIVVLGERPFLIEYAMLSVLNSLLVEADAGPTFEKDGWQQMAGAVGGTVWKGALATATPILTALGTIAATGTSIPVVGWVTAAIAAVGAAITAAVASISQAGQISSKFMEVIEGFEKQVRRIMGLFDMKYEDLPSYRMGLLIDGGSMGQNKLWKIFTYQEDWWLFRKIIAQIPVFYHYLPFSLPVWKDIWRTTYIGVGNNGRGVSYDERTKSLDYSKKNNPKA